MSTTREVRLLLVSATGEPLGGLGPVTVPTRWWPDVEPVVAAVRERWDLDVTVLRVLSGESQPAPVPEGEEPELVGGSVTYLAEAARGSRLPADLEPVADERVRAALADHPLRAPWARVGGPASIVAWADEVLAGRGTPRTGPVEQVKTWNLSSILRLPTAAGPVWCKSVPGFFAHEAALVELVARRRPALVPRLLGADPATGTVLMADVPGEDQWGAPLSRLLQMVHATTELQQETAQQVDELRALGLPDWRGPALVASLVALGGRPDVRAGLDAAEQDGLYALLARLPDVVDDLAACGLPDTLVHGDLHPGNWRYGSDGLVLLDWGDSGVGNPLLDLPAFVSRLEEPARTTVRSAWAQAWEQHVPGARAARAMELVAPLAALRQALIYQGFVDRIEPDERPYHRGDVPHWLRVALAEDPQDVGATFGMGQSL